MSCSFFRNGIVSAEWMLLISFETVCETCDPDKHHGRQVNAHTHMKMAWVSWNCLVVGFLDPVTKRRTLRDASACQPASVHQLLSLTSYNVIKQLAGGELKEL